MVVEHEFVTTLEPGEALTNGSRYLTQCGFWAEQGAFAVGQTEWTSLDMKRGRAAASRAKNISELPQRAIIRYDRGRVSVALSIQPSVAWGGRSTFSVSIGFGMESVKENPKYMAVHQKMLITIANGLQAAMCSKEIPADIMQPLYGVQQEVLDAAKARRRQMWIVAGVVVLAIIVLIVVIASLVGRR